jgi:hypothetical protein
MNVEKFDSSFNQNALNINDDLMFEELEQRIAPTVIPPHGSSSSCSSSSVLA